MLRFSANLTMMFNEVDFPDRFERAGRVGFKGVEYLFPYGWGKEQLVDKLGKHHLKQVLHNLPAGNWQAGGVSHACQDEKESIKKVWNWRLSMPGP
jgi:hydroxypyruvate isomerase